MNRPKEGEYWVHKNLDFEIYIVAVGIRNVLAIDRKLGEDKYYIPDLLEWYERKESTSR